MLKQAQTGEGAEPAPITGGYFGVSRIATKNSRAAVVTAGAAFTATIFCAEAYFLRISSALIGPGPEVAI